MTTFRPGMTDAEIDAHVAEFVRSIEDGSLRRECEARVDPDWLATYGDAAWRAALAQMGEPERTS